MVCTIRIFLIKTDGVGSCSAKVLTHCSWKIRAASEAVANIIYWMYRQALGNFGGGYKALFLLPESTGYQFETNDQRDVNPCKKGIDCPGMMRRLGRS